MAFALLKPAYHDVYPFVDPTNNLKGAAAGKSVLVTGAGTGIGVSIAECFALAGASTVILAARRTEKLEATKAGIADLAPDCKVIVVGTDVANRQSVEKLFESLDHVPDVIVSNAAASRDEPIIDSNPDVWWNQVDVNIRGPYLIARSYLRAARAAGKKGGRIINVSSNGAWRVFPGLSAYSASKSGLDTFTEHLDVECVKDGSGMRSVAMHPGGVVTEMASAPHVPDAIRKLLIDKPALAGSTAVYLSTERADFLMGRFVNATWDMEALEGVKERVLEEDLLRTRVIGLVGGS
ncbi:hypothetical protein LTS10_011210 [Elasticomyces elasticus]|nr:hypothetical protein LTS10_011210 [Elasticomyces elasticus]